jgi:hypothetical protein
MDTYKDDIIDDLTTTIDIVGAKIYNKKYLRPTGTYAFFNQKSRDLPLQ